MTGTFAEVLHDSPDVLEALERAHDAAWATVDRRLLELGRLRIAELLGNEPALGPPTPGSGVDEATAAAVAAWPTDERFGERDRAALAFTEQFVIDVASLTDELVAELRDHLGDQGLADFTNALLVIEQRQRLGLVWERVL